MDILPSFVAESTLVEFADRHGLVMEIHERSRDTIACSWIGPQRRFYAHFKSAEVKEGGMLCGASGSGPTPDAAMDAYAKEISERTLVIDAYKSSRREIKAPRLVGLK